MLSRKNLWNSRPVTSWPQVSGSMQVTSSAHSFLQWTNTYSCLCVTHNKAQREGKESKVPRERRNIFRLNPMTVCLRRRTLYCSSAWELHISDGANLPHNTPSNIVLTVINPWRACAVRVTVLGVSACVYVCLLPLFCHPRLQGGQRTIPTASVLRRHGY